MRAFLTISVLSFAAGLLYLLYYIGYLVPQQIDDVLLSQHSPSQQLAEISAIVQKIFTYVAAEFFLALFLVIVMAIYMSRLRATNVIYVEQVQKKENNLPEQHQTSFHSDEHIIKQLSDNITALVKNSTSTHDIHALLETFLRQVCNATEAVVGVCYLCNQASETVQAVAGYALSEPLAIEPFAYGEGFVGQVAKSGKLLCVHTVPKEYLPVKSGLGNASPARLVCMPVVENQQVIGILELGFFRQVSNNFLENLQKTIDLSVPLFKTSAMQLKGTAHI
ncbi:MAG: GAF domain-containing protein [Cytophagales bacterium]|nr:GAF domain-containing protein [Bernardetiaceae bacterium]MDW8209505.1 GAF domain-containing protein [Cytophagales bacterium]